MILPQGQHAALPTPLSGFEKSNRYRVPVMRNLPVIDGFVDAAEWAVSAGFDGMTVCDGNGRIEERAVRAYVGATQTHFCFAVVSELPSGEALISAVKQPTDRIAHDDAVEVYIDPSPGSTDGVTYHVLVNSAGVTAYEARPRGSVSPDSVYAWRGECSSVSGFHGGCWHCEIAIPIGSIAPGRSIMNGRWGINRCRSFKQPWVFTSLNAGSYEPGLDVVFEFAEEACAAIHMRHETDPTSRDIDVRLSFHNSMTMNTTNNSKHLGHEPPGELTDRRSSTQPV